MTTPLEQSIQPSPDDLVRRAFSAWYRHSGGYPLHEQPDQSLSGLENHGGLDYVVLRNVRGIITVYRVRRSGQLKRLVKIPAKIEQNSAKAD